MDLKLPLFTIGLLFVLAFLGVPASFIGAFFLAMIPISIIVQLSRYGNLRFTYFSPPKRTHGSK